MMNTRAKRCWLLMLIFLVPLSAEAVSADMVISEIGAFEKNGEEWVELYNRAEHQVNIEGWKFVEEFSVKNSKGVAHKLRAFQGDFVIDPHEYMLIAQNADLFQKNHPGFLGTIIDSSWSSLKKAGERVELKDQNGVVVESFAYPSSPSKTSLQRVSMEQSGEEQSNWQSHSTSHSAGTQNVFGASVPKAPHDARKSAGTKKEASPLLPNVQKEAQAINLHIEKQRGVALQPALPHAKFVAPKGPWDKIVYQALPRSLPARDERTPLLKKLGAALGITTLLLAISWRKKGKQGA